MMRCSVAVRGWGSFLETMQEAKLSRFGYRGGFCRCTGTGPSAGKCEFARDQPP